MLKADANGGLDRGTDFSAPGYGLCSIGWITASYWLVCLICAGNGSRCVWVFPSTKFGPVALASLMSATVIQPYAALGPEAVIAYSAVLAIMVGIFRLSLGLLRLGMLVDFLSHPVVIGFTNAGAIIIATSQLPKLFRCCR